MTTLDPNLRVPPLPRERSNLRVVAVPTEHGGWSLTLEPVLLGLIVAWSWSGLALGAAAMLAFVARTPLKVVLVDRRRHRWIERTGVAARVVTFELVVMVALVAPAAWTAQGAFWVPILLVAPLILVELWYDMRSRSRRLLPELAGTIGIAGTAAAIALAAGRSTGLAVGLWCVLAARGAAAVPHVRTQVLRLRGRPHRRWHSDLAQVAGLATVAVAWIRGLIPLAPVAAIAALAMFNLVAIRRPPRQPKVLGFQQLGFGIAVIAVSAVSVHAS